MSLSKKYLALNEGKLNEELPLKLKTAMERLEAKPAAKKAELAVNLLHEIIAQLATSAQGIRELKEFAPVAYAFVVQNYEMTPEDDAEVADANSDDVGNGRYTYQIVPFNNDKEGIANPENVDLNKMNFEQFKEVLDANNLEISGANTRRGNRPELLGRPSVGGLNGPMWNGNNVIRYEATNNLKLN